MRLSAENVSVTLGGRPVVRNVDLRLEPGEILGLLGPNGAGKSTLIRALTGHLPFEGSVRLDGRDLAVLSHNERARLIAYLPQARTIGWSLTVENLVGLGRLPWRGFGGRPTAKDAEICADAMALMDVAGLAARPATELSGGEQARVLTARAVAQDTPVLLADEPASGLDPAHQITMMKALRKLAGRDRAILVSLHDLTLAARWCDRIVMLKEGRVAVEGKPETVMTAEWLKDVFGVAARIEHDSDGLILAPIGLVEDAP